MPKVSSDTPSRQGPLRRNKACHQCRRKKMRCDGKQPCETCMRGHRQVIAAKLVKGETFDQYPNCTFDDSSSSQDVPIKSPSDSPIQTISQEQCTSSSTANPIVQPAFNVQCHTLEVELGLFNASPNAEIVDGGLPPILGGGILSEEFFVKTVIPSQLAPSAPALTEQDYGQTLPTPQDSVLPILYPTTLPPPFLLHHLIHTFFSCVPFSTRMFHQPTFLASLHELPTSRSYPSTAVLHAICAISAMYSNVTQVSPRSRSVLKDRPAQPIFLTLEDMQSEQGMGPGGDFPTEQAALARAMAEFDSRTGRHGLDAIRTMIILGFFYYINAQWVDAWAYAHQSMLSAIPAGLNRRSTGMRNKNWIDNQSMLPLTNDPIELETRRNVFWLCFVLERHQHMATRWGGAVDERDISQELPGRVLDFEAGFVAGGPYQRLAAPDLLSVHPPERTDPFTLLIKGTALISRIIIFYSRLKLQGETDLESSFPLGQPKAEIRASAGFKELDNMVDTFKLNIPREYRDPFNRGMMMNSPRSGQQMSIDPICYAAHILPAAAIVILHEPHIDPGDMNQLSTAKALSAARDIVDSVCRLSSSAFDPIFLPPTIIHAWSLASQVLATFYHYAMSKGKMAEADVLRGEIDVMLLIIGCLGEKMPMAAGKYKDIVYNLNLGRTVALV